MKIERIEVFVTDLPVRLRRRTATAVSDTGASGDLMAKPVLVKIWAEGVVGYGQTRPTGRQHWTPETSYSIVTAVRDYYGPHLIGAELTDIELIWSDFDRILPKNGAARAALDYAMHDALGKALGVPAHDLIGGCARESIPLEWSVAMTDTAEELVDKCQQARDEHGIRNFSLKSGGSEGWMADVRMVAALREAMGDDITIGVDTNTGWTISESIRAIKEMQKYDLAYVEQPSAPDDLAGLAFIRQSVAGVAVIADECLNTLSDAYAIAQAKAADVLCVKLMKVGGMAQARKVTAVAEAAHLQVNVGGTAIMSQLEAAAIAHYCATVPDHRFLDGGEFIFGLGGMMDDPLVPEPDFVIADGHAKVPTAPGLGIVPDEAAINKLALLHDVVSTD